MNEVPELIETTLYNGLHVMVQPLPGRLTASIVIAFPAGSYYETRETNGGSHFLEHMFFRGGLRYPTEADVVAAIATAGADMNAETLEETVSYQIIKIPADVLSVGFDVQSDMVLNGRMNQADMEPERGAILQEIAEAQDDAEEGALRALRRILYTDSPLRWEICGSAENVRRFTRDDLLRLREMHYFADGAALAIVGGVDPEAVIENAERFYGDLPKAPSRRPVRAPFVAASRDDRIAFETMPREQVWMYVSVPAPKRNDSRAATCRVLANALGGHVGARLFLRVRSNLGLAYSVWAEHVDATTHGFLNAYAGVDPANAVSAIRAIVDVCRSFVENPMDKAECARTKDFIAGQRKGILEGTDDVATKLAEDFVLDGYSTSIPRHIAECENVTAAQVQALAEEMFQRGNMKLALAGPVNDAMIDEIRTCVPEFT